MSHKEVQKFDQQRVRRAFDRAADSYQQFAESKIRVLAGNR